MKISKDEKIRKRLNLLIEKEHLNSKKEEIPIWSSKIGCFIYQDRLFNTYSELEKYIKHAKTNSK